MAKLLLIETATEVCSVALSVDDRVVALAEETEQANHAARLTLLIDQCVRQSGIRLAELDAVALSRGPGSYTALRVGASVAKGICYALDKPLIAVDTLQALAWASREDCGLRIADCGLEVSGLESEPYPNLERPIRNPQSVFFLPMLDARRQEVWAAVYDSQLHEVLPAQPLILENNLLFEFLKTVPGAEAERRFVLSGNGVKKIGTDLIGENMAVSAIKKCTAETLTLLAGSFFQRSVFQDISYFEPLYMKMPNITTPNKPAI